MSGAVACAQVVIIHRFLGGSASTVTAGPFYVTAESTYLPGAVIQDAFKAPESQDALACGGQEQDAFGVFLAEQWVFVPGSIEQFAETVQVAPIDDVFVPGAIMQTAYPFGSIEQDSMVLGAITQSGFVSGSLEQDAKTFGATEQDAN